MQQTTERPTAPARHGFFEWFRLRAGGVDGQRERRPAAATLGPNTVIDLRGDLPATEWRLAVSERLDRLDEGMSIVARTMKQAFAQVHRSMEDLHGGASGSGDQLERILQESVASLQAAVEDLSESIHRVPFVLAAAADDITAKLEEVATDTGPEAHPIPPVSPDPDHQPPSELLPATPFELEPVEDQFVPMDEDAEGRDARKIWGMEA